MSEATYQFRLGGAHIREAAFLANRKPALWMQILEQMRGATSVVGYAAIVVVLTFLYFGGQTSLQIGLALGIITGVATSILYYLATKWHVDAIIKENMQSRHTSMTVTAKVGPDGWSSANNMSQTRLSWDQIDTVVRGQHGLYLKSDDLVFCLPFDVIGDDANITKLESDIQGWLRTAVFA